MHYTYQVILPYHNLSLVQKWRNQNHLFINFKQICFLKFMARVLFVHFDHFLFKCFLDTVVKYIIQISFLLSINFVVCKYYLNILSKLKNINFHKNNNSRVFFHWLSCEGSLLREPPSQDS